MSLLTEYAQPELSTIIAKQVETIKCNNDLIEQESEVKPNGRKYGKTSGVAQ